MRTRTRHARGWRRCRRQNPSGLPEGSGAISTRKGGECTAPRTTRNQAVRRLHAGPPVSDGGTKMATILIVDDDEALLKMLQISLGKAHYDVRTALDGDEALRQLKQGGVDLMVTDVVMPGKEGVELMLQ